MSAPTVHRVSETEPVPYVLVSGPAFAIQLPNGTLYREPNARLYNPESNRPTVWFTREGAEAQRHLTAVMLELWYGIDPEGPTELRVVQVDYVAETDEWRIVLPADEDRGYRPLNPDTEELSAWRCGDTDALTVDEARQVMRDHRECAGVLPCKIRGRARALLVREGVLRLNMRPTAWLALHLPDDAAGW